MKKRKVMFIDVLPAAWVHTTLSQHLGTLFAFLHVGPPLLDHTAWSIVHLQSQFKQQQESVDWQSNT